jgi:hypothetical protein
MSQSAPYLTHEDVRRTLIAVFDRALPACEQVQYRLVGTGAALMLGVDLPAGDVDILVMDRQGVDAFTAALKGFPCLVPPAWMPDMRQYYANFDVNGIEVGFSTVEIESDVDTIETFGPGPWEHFSLVTCGRYAIPVVALELRLITEMWRNRRNRYRPIIRFMRQHGCDMALIKRGLDQHDFPLALVNEVLSQLPEA